MLGASLRYMRSGIFLAPALVCALLVGCKNPTPKMETCSKEGGCLNEQLIGFLSKRCQHGKPCSFSFNEIFSDRKIGKVYFSNKFGAHPSLGACKQLPMSKELSESSRFGCEYAILAAEDKFVGYVRGSCDASLVQLPMADTIVFAKGFESAGLSIAASEKLSVERDRVKQPGADGVMREADYYYLQLDKNKGAILQNECFHF